MWSEEVYVVKKMLVVKPCQYLQHVSKQLLGGFGTQDMCWLDPCDSTTRCSSILKRISHVIPTQRCGVDGACTIQCILMFSKSPNRKPCALHIPNKRYLIGLQLFLFMHPLSKHSRHSILMENNSTQKYFCSLPCHERKISKSDFRKSVRVHNWLQAHISAEFY